MKRILVIGKRGGILHWYEDVLTAAGPDASGFTLNHHNFASRMAGHLLGKQDARVRKLVHDGLAATLARLQPELVLIVDLFYLEPPVNALLQSCGATVVQWIGDRFEDRLARNTAVQHFYWTDTGLLEPARRLGLPEGRYLPLAANLPEAPLPAWNERREDILFIGAPSANRIALLEQLDHPVRVIGPGWPAFRNPKITVTPRRMAVMKARELYRQHKFVLNIINRDNIISGLPSRCFDATAHGACLLTDNVTDLARNFEPGREVLAYDDAGQLAGLMRTLADADLGAIAEAGQQRTAREHRFADRLAVLHGQS